MAFSRLSKLTTGALLTAYYPMTIFLVVSIPCFALLLAGCSSHHASLPSIYLISLSYPNLTSNNASGINKDLSSLFAPLVGNAQLTVRTGYYGLCLGLENKDWMCSNDAAGLKDHVNATQDPLNLIAMSMLFKDHIVVPGLLFISLALGLLSVCVLAAFYPPRYEETDDTGSVREVIPFPSQTLLNSGCGILALGVLCGLIASLWQHTAAVAAAATAQNFAYGFVKSEVGAAAMGLGWAMLAAYLIALCLLIGANLSYRLLDRMTNEEE